MRAATIGVRKLVGRDFANAVAIDLSLLLQLCVPDWPFYNRHPIKWLDSIPDRREHAKSS
jgi:Microsomal signal peptidase 12 kDa subunit (SPC12)